MKKYNNRLKRLMLKTHSFIPGSHFRTVMDFDELEMKKRGVSPSDFSEDELAEMDAKLNAWKCKTDRSYDELEELIAENKDLFLVNMYRFKKDHWNEIKRGGWFLNKTARKYKILVEEANRALNRDS